jgi:hypothetical protein
MASQREKNLSWFIQRFRLPASNKADTAVSPTDGTLAESCADSHDYDFDKFFRRPGRGRRALRRAAIFFLGLLTKPPLRPFSWLTNCLALLRTSPPNLPSATACGFFPFLLFLPLAPSRHLLALHKTHHPPDLTTYANCLASLCQVMATYSLGQSSNDFLRVSHFQLGRRTDEVVRVDREPRRFSPDSSRLRVHGIDGRFS